VDDAPAETSELVVTAADFLNDPRHWVLKLGRDQWLVITEATEHAAKVVGCRPLAEVSKLSLTEAEIGDAGVEQLVELMAESRLTGLKLGTNKIGSAGLVSLVESPLGRRLTDLDLYWNDIDADGIERLVSLGQCQLRKLNISANDYGIPGARLLSRWPVIGQLHELDVGYSEIGDEGAAALARSPHIAGLKRLDLAGSGIRAGGAEALVSSRQLRPVTELYLDNYIAKLGFLGPDYRNYVPRPWRQKLYDRFEEQLVLDFYLGAELEQSLNNLIDVIQRRIGRGTHDYSDAPDPSEPGIVVLYS
jgi:hypothetical protein